jgi:hypothetical protein
VKPDRSRPIYVPGWAAPWLQGFFLDEKTHDTNFDAAMAHKKRSGMTQPPNARDDVDQITTNPGKTTAR